MNKLEDAARLGQLGPENLPQPLVTESDDQIACPLNWNFDDSFRLQSQRDKPIVVDLNRIRGFVFDNDGLLVNSERSIVTCVFRAAEEMVRKDLDLESFHFSPEEVAVVKRSFGKGERDMVLSLRESLIAMGHAGPQIRSMSENRFFENLVQQRVELYTQALRNGEVTITPGAEELLKALHEHGVVVALCTGSAEPFISAQFDVLFRGGKLPEIDTIIPAELRIHGDALPKGFGKPSAFSYQRIAARIQRFYQDITPGDLAFAEDTRSGLVAGLQAGYQLGIHIPQNLEFAALEDPAADHSVARLMSYYEDHELELKNPSRIVVGGGLDRIVLKLKDGSYWLPPYYQRYPELIQGL